MTAVRPENSCIVYSFNYSRVGGVSHLIKSGIVYDAKQLLDDVRTMVREARDVEESEAATAVLETTLGDIEVEVFVDND